MKKSKESYKHLYAKKVLASWVAGEVEKAVNIDGYIAFVPDVTCAGVFYEVVHTHPVTGKKLGMIQYWCYRNGISVSLYEVSAEYILRQTEKPDKIHYDEVYNISFE